MRITFICAVFPPEPAPSGVMAQQLAARLARDGHDVTVIVPVPNRPDGVIFPGFRRRLRSRTATPDLYALVRCANWLIGKHRRNANRILENLTFGLSSAWAAWREGRPDLIIIETWPLVAAQIAAFLARWWRVPYLYYVKDVYPEAAEAAGMLTPGGRIARACRAWDRQLCLKSASTVVISESMRDLMAEKRGLPRDCFTVIPDWLDKAAFPVAQGEGTWRRSQDIPGAAFVAMFAGTLGHVSGAEVLVKVAKILSEQESILVLCIGEGILKKPMQEASSRLGLKNIRFLPFQPGELVPEVQASCDVALLTMQPGNSDASVPSKLITYLAAGRPVICAANASSAVARAVVDAAAGLIVAPGDAQGIAGAIGRLRREPEMARQMGRNARSYFERHYTLERGYNQISELILRVTPQQGHTIDPTASARSNRASSVAEMRVGKDDASLSPDESVAGSPSDTGIVARLVALILCVVGLPVHLLICACIALADGGPPLYRSKRSGQFGKPFSMLKYRTMTVNCKPVVRADYKVVVESDDPRVTPIGRLLRCGIDELPQLWNIVRGEMAWVGPRPAEAWMLPHYGSLGRQRISVAPGITGFSQVLNSRNLPTAESFAIDLWYVANRSLWLDLWAIAMTPLFIAGWSSVGRRRLRRLRSLKEFEVLRRGCEAEVGADAAGSVPEQYAAHESLAR